MGFRCLWGCKRILIRVALIIRARGIILAEQVPGTLALALVIAGILCSARIPVVAEVPHFRVMAAGSLVAGIVGTGIPVIAVQIRTQVGGRGGSLSRRDSLPFLPGRRWSRIRSPRHHLG